MSHFLALFLESGRRQSVSLTHMSSGACGPKSRSRALQALARGLPARRTLFVFYGRKRSRRKRTSAAISGLGQIELAIQFLRNPAADSTGTAEAEEHLAFGLDANKLELAHKLFFRLVGI